MPSREALQRAVAVLDREFADCRIAWGWDDNHRRWTSSDARGTAATVVQGGRIDEFDIAEMLDHMVAFGPDDAPLSLIRFDDFLGLKMSHAVGDGRTFNEIFAAVMTTALTAEPYRWRIGPTNRFPLASAVLRTFGRHPGLVRSAWADRPDRTPPRPGPMTEWTPARRTLVAYVEPEIKRSLMAAARSTEPGATWLSVLIARLLAGLHHAGVAVAPDISVVVDLRRYLRSELLDGNFVVGVPIHVGHCSSPGAVASVLEGAVRSGRPLATQAAATIGSLRGGTVSSTSVNTAEPVRVTFSAMGKPPQVNALPFVPGHPAIYCGSVNPDGAQGLTFLVTETPNRCIVTASFHENVLPTAAVADAMASVAATSGDRVAGQAVRSWSE